MDHTISSYMRFMDSYSIELNGPLPDLISVTVLACTMSLHCRHGEEGGGEGEATHSDLLLATSGPSTSPVNRNTNYEWELFKRIS